MLKKLNKNQKGFTLVELIIVIAILGVLSALLVPRIMGNVDNATRNKEISNARTIASEITNHNAQMKAEGKTSDVITGNVTASTTFPASFTLPAGVTFPDSTVVTIEVDAAGNASINIITPTPTT